ncbi:MAG: GPW/gp25 family protein [Saprospiraceae bacterium]|nr:GPW/gp25 family protein [Saprospiraceae bacterium]
MHIRNLIKQVLFTSPGERVNRPDFGSGLLQMVFQPNSSELATTTQFLVQGALNLWLSDRIEVHSVQVENEDAKLLVTVAYTVLKTGETQTAQFSS